MKPRLQYEPLVAAHAAALFAVLADEEVWRYLDPPDSATVAELAAELACRAAGPVARVDERWVNFAVRVADDGPYIGRIEATVHGEWAEVAYLFGPAHWNRGYATEAMQWLRDHLRDLGVRELWAATRADNERSRRLLSRLGFAVAPPLRPLTSYGAGDLVLRWPPLPPSHSPAP